MSGTKAVELAKAQVLQTLERSGLSREAKTDLLDKMLHNGSYDQRETVREIKKQQRKIKILSTRVDRLTADKRAIVLKLFREYDIEGNSSSPREIETLMMLVANLNTVRDNAAATVLDAMPDIVAFTQRFAGWATQWKKCAFARLSVGAKLGAALMLTDAPEGVVAPWEAWSLCVPDGIIKAQTSTRTFSVMRLWCYGTEPVAAVAKSDTDKEAYFINSFDDDDTPWKALARNFVKGACLSLSIDVETHRKANWGPRGSKRAPGVVPDAGVDYVLSGTVEIDLRDEVKRICEGRKSSGGHGGLTVQFLVRGHWRNQAVGVRHSDRKRIWIEPFWKGPEESRVLLRTHRIKTEDGET